MKGTDYLFAMKKLKKSEMIEKEQVRPLSQRFLSRPLPARLHRLAITILFGQVKHVRAERDALVDIRNPWVVALHYSFQVLAVLHPSIQLVLAFLTRCAMTRTWTTCT
jgi:hypothetical protein